MKFLFSSFEEMLPQVLLLRFGDSNPQKLMKALFSRQTVSKFLNIPLRNLISLEQKHFRIYKNKQKFFFSKENVQLLTSTEYLLQNSTASIIQRVLHINTNIQNGNLNNYQLIQLYRKFNIKKKKIIKKPGNPRKYSKELQEQLLIEMRKNLMDVNNDGYEIFQIDESLFNAQDSQKIGWSKPRENIIINQIGRHNQSLTVTGAISQSQSKIFSHLKKGYVNQVDFVGFLQQLKRQNCGRKIALFLDNCSVHKSKQVREYCEKAKIPIVFNIPYCPQYNGIEKLWAMWNQIFRKKIQDLKIQGTEFKVEQTIQSSMELIKKETVIKCCRHGWLNIFREQIGMFQSLKYEQ